MEQPRRNNRECGVSNRRMNAIKHNHPAIVKETIGVPSAGGVTTGIFFKKPIKSYLIITNYKSKLLIFFPGNTNGMNVISLALQGPSVALVRNPVNGTTEDIGYTYNHPLQARGPTSMS